jgi:hypothetical protein
VASANVRRSYHDPCHYIHASRLMGKEHLQAEGLTHRDLPVADTPHDIEVNSEGRFTCIRKFFY